jgi:hypothetical protein
MHVASASSSSLVLGIGMSLIIHRAPFFFIPPPHTLQTPPIPGIHARLPFSLFFLNAADAFWNAV